MRLRIRGPGGQSTVALEDSATVETLKKTISTETSLASFDVKYGYPPKTLPLDQYPATAKLSELDIKLSGEQLIVSKREVSSTKDLTHITSESTGDAVDKSTNAALSKSTVASQKDSAFSWDISGTASSSMFPKDQGSRRSDTPLNLSRKSNAEMDDPPELLLPELGGTLLLRIMPDDNSCLFRAIASAVMPGIDTMTEMRSFVAQTIQGNPEKYSKAVLDNKEPEDYCRWIQTEAAWGGQIELDILSRQFDLEICSIDVQSLRVDRYNDRMPTRCIVVYSGIHYDTIALNPFESPPEDDIKVFNPNSKEEILAEAVVLCQSLKDRHYYTDTGAFKIRCNECSAICVGETGATEHASKTGHYNFGEAG